MNTIRTIGYLEKIAELLMIDSVMRNIRLSLFRKAWRKSNRHNDTYPVRYVSVRNVTVGKYSYGPLDITAFEAENEGLQIGNYVSLARGVRFILGGNHATSGFSTYPFGSRFIRGGKGSTSKGPIVVEDDVWIGMDTIILSGVRIGKGAVIGAGSVVTRDIPPYAIAAGNPAVVKKYRFTSDVISELTELHMDDFLVDRIDEKTIKYLYDNLSMDGLRNIKKIFFSHR